MLMSELNHITIEVHYNVVIEAATTYLVARTKRIARERDELIKKTQLKRSKRLWNPFTGSVDYDVIRQEFINDKSLTSQWYAIEERSGYYAKLVKNILAAASVIKQLEKEKRTVNPMITVPAVLATELFRQHWSHVKELTVIEK